MTRKVLLASGIAAPLLYAVADLVAGMQSSGYSFRDQTISELGAIGAPSRLIFSVLLTAVYALMTAFGVGVWKAAGTNSRLEAVGALLVGLGLLALTAGPFAAMRPRGAPQGFAGMLHLLEGMVAMLLVFSAMAIAATAFGWRFGVYTVTTIALALVLDGWAASEAPAIARGLATPWVGVKERVFWYGYQSWFIVLALVLLRRAPKLTSRGGVAMR
ncbi:MAG TPA: DUF998 domain-containing protein [Vicinamibacterales bacterium]|nr:DUF998 domain-containing protein [Vicinamibacterales bacterium]